MPVHYLGRQGIARRWGVEPRRLDGMCGVGLALPPDVEVGRRHGWAESRVVGFGQSAGLLDARGNPVGLPRYSPLHLPGDLGDWTVRLQTYLSQRQAAQRLGLTSEYRVIKLRSAGRFAPPAVAIVTAGGSGTGEIHGWNAKDIDRWARQTGRGHRLVQG